MPRARNMADIDRDARAVDLRRQHLSYRQIANAMGLRSPSAAHEAVRRGLADALTEPADEVRQMELERLDSYAQIAWEVLHAEHLVVASSGKVALHPDTGMPLLDDGPKLAALDRLMRLSESRRKLLGLDAPVRAEVRHVDTFDADIARLVADMASGGQEPPAGHPEVLPVETKGTS